MKTDLKNKKVLVVGLGRSGVAAANLLVKQGSEVYASDQAKTSSSLSLSRKVHVERGSHRFFSQAYDLIVVSPGVHWDHPFLLKSRWKGIPVWSEFELAYRLCRPKSIIAVTGTNGKTTTTALIGWLLKQAGKKVVVAGNIGIPLSALLHKITPQTILVLEVSSYQLESAQVFHPQVGAFLNLTPDHLKRHGTMANYGRIKARLFAHMKRTDVAVLNHQDAWVKRSTKAHKVKKVWFPNLNLKKLADHTCLMGKHNALNVMAAVACVKAVGLRDTLIKKGLKSFKGVPHRLELVKRRGGVLYVNDSKATNVDSTRVAVQSYSNRLFLIMGGQHKGSSYKPLIPLLRKKVKKILTIGEAEEKIRRDLSRVAPVKACHTLKRAVQQAFHEASSGDVVLFSPACASFDQFKNFEVRGDAFKTLVKGLPG